MGRPSDGAQRRRRRLPLRRDRRPQPQRPAPEQRRRRRARRHRRDPARRAGRNRRRRAIPSRPTAAARRRWPATTTATAAATGPACSRWRATYAYGVRNSFGMALDPVTGALWMTENGPEQLRRDEPRPARFEQRLEPDHGSGRARPAGRGGSLEHARRGLDLQRSGVLLVHDDRADRHRVAVREQSRAPTTTTW